MMYSLAFVRARYVCGHNLSLYYDYCDVQFGVCLHEMSVDISLYCDVQFVVWLAEMSVDISLYCDVQSGFCPCQICMWT